MSIDLPTALGLRSLRKTRRRKIGSGPNLDIRPGLRFPDFDPSLVQIDRMIQRQQRMMRANYPSEDVFAEIEIITQAAIMAPEFLMRRKIVPDPKYFDKMLYWMAAAHFYETTLPEWKRSTTKGDQLWAKFLSNEIQPWLGYTLDSQQRGDRIEGSIMFPDPVVQTVVVMLLSSEFSTDRFNDVFFKDVDSPHARVYNIAVFPFMEPVLQPHSNLYSASSLFAHDLTHSNIICGNMKFYLKTHTWAMVRESPLVQLWKQCAIMHPWLRKLTQLYVFVCIHEDFIHRDGQLAEALAFELVPVFISRSLFDGGYLESAMFQELLYENSSPQQRQQFFSEHEEPDDDDEVTIYDEKIQPGNFSFVRDRQLHALNGAQLITSKDTVFFKTLFDQLRMNPSMQPPDLEPFFDQLTQTIQDGIQNDKSARASLARFIREQYSEYGAAYIRENYPRRRDKSIVRETLGDDAYEYIYGNAKKRKVG